MNAKKCGLYPILDVAGNSECSKEGCRLTKQIPALEREQWE